VPTKRSFTPDAVLCGAARRRIHTECVAVCTGCIAVPYTARRTASARCDGTASMQLACTSRSTVRRRRLCVQVGDKWKDLAWSLFAGAHTDAETLRMIADIELKHPDDLSDQVQDMMARWWRRLGSAATVTQLRDALDLVQVPYVDEDGAGLQPSFSTSFVVDSDADELDVGEVDEQDPDVSRLMRSYRTRYTSRQALSHRIRHGTAPYGVVRCCIRRERAFDDGVNASVGVIAVRQPAEFYLNTHIHWGDHDTL